MNCGYARVAIWKSQAAELKDNLKSQFGDQTYGLTDDLFEKRGKRESKMEYMNKLLEKAFSKKWNPQSARTSYLKTFSSERWSAQNPATRRKHTLSSCKECRDSYTHLQEKFPMKPVHSQPEPPTITVKTKPTHNNEASTVKYLISNLNTTFEEALGHSFTESAIEHCKEEGLAVKKTKSEAKKEKRALLRRCRDEVSRQMGENAALSTLVEDESLARYNRKRMAQSFVKPPAPKKKRSHGVPPEQMRPEILKDLSSFPTDKKINWSKFAREHGLKERKE